MSNETVGNVARKDERLWTCMEAARRCAMVILESGTYIRQELPNVEVDAALRAEAEALCDYYVGTKHDVMTELNELAELVMEGCSPEVALLRVNRIAGWLAEPAVKAHPLVKALEANARLDERGALAYLLVAESATNVLTALQAVWSTRDHYLRSGSGSTPN